MPRKKKSPIDVIGGQIPVDILIDGRPSEPLTADYQKQVAGLAKNKFLLDEIRRFIGEKIKDWLAHPESSEFLQAQIYGVSDFFQRLKQIEAMERDGIKNDTIEDHLILNDELK